MCVKSQQIHQLLVQFINYVWYLLHVAALYRHPQGAFLVPSERCSFDHLSEGTRNKLSEKLVEFECKLKHLNHA
jgi:hypothetical protein